MSRVERGPTTDLTAPAATAERDPAAPSFVALLVAPDRSMALQARLGRVRWLLLFAWLCSLLLGVALAWRLDARASTLRTLEASGELTSLSDRQIAEKTEQSARVAQVAAVAKGAVRAPLALGLACASLLVLGWFLHGRLRGRAIGPVGAATLLPGAIANLLDALVAFRHEALPPEGVPLSPRSASALLAALGHPLALPWLKLGNALDFFSLWAAVMLGFGLAAAAEVPRSRALVGTLGAWVCYRLLTEVAAGG